MSLFASLYAQNNCRRFCIAALLMQFARSLSAPRSTLTPIYFLNNTRSDFSQRVLWKCIMKNAGRKWTEERVVLPPALCWRGLDWAIFSRHQFFILYWKTSFNYCRVSVFKKYLSTMRNPYHLIITFLILVKKVCLVKTWMQYKQLTDEGTYLSMLPEGRLGSVLSYWDLSGYHQYQYSNIVLLWDVSFFPPTRIERIIQFFSLRNCRNSTKPCIKELLLLRHK